MPGHHLEAGTQLSTNSGAVSYFNNFVERLKRLIRGTYDTLPSTTYEYRCKCCEATSALRPVLTTAIPAIGRVARAERELAAGTTSAPHTRVVANPPAINARARLRSR
jgi:hypothetical protein